MMICCKISLLLSLIVEKNENRSFAKLCVRLTSGYGVAVRLSDSQCKLRVQRCSLSARRIVARLVFVYWNACKRQPFIDTGKLDNKKCSSAIYTVQ